MGLLHVSNKCGKQEIDFSAKGLSVYWLAFETCFSIKVQCIQKYTMHCELRMSLPVWNFLFGSKHIVWAAVQLLMTLGSPSQQQAGEIGRFSCNTWEGTPVTCNMALQAGNQFHSFEILKNLFSFSSWKCPLYILFVSSLCTKITVQNKVEEPNGGMKNWCIFPRVNFHTTPPTLWCPVLQLNLPVTPAMLWRWNYTAAILMCLLPNRKWHSGLTEDAQKMHKGECICINNLCPPNITPFLSTCCWPLQSFLSCPQKRTK